MKISKNRDSTTSLGNLLFQCLTALIMWIFPLFPIGTLSQFLSVVSHSSATHLGCISNLFITLRLLLDALHLFFSGLNKPSSFSLSLQVTYSNTMTILVPHSSSSTSSSHWESQKCGLSYKIQGKEARSLPRIYFQAMQFYSSKDGHLSACSFPRVRKA